MQGVLTWLQVREHEVSKDGQQASEQQTGSLQKDVEGKRSQLEQWCATAYGEVRMPALGLIRGRHVSMTCRLSL